jgi:RNase P subunit RPR2
MGTKLRVSHNTAYYEELNCKVCESVMLTGKTVSTGETVTCDDCGEDHLFIWNGMTVEQIAGPKE